MKNDLVRDSYNRIAATYAAQRDQFKNNSYLALLCDRLPIGASVLDIGCGAGQPVDSYLLQRAFRVSGIDSSVEMIELAKRNNPTAAYDIRDMLELVSGEYHVDAVVSFYTVFHVPREKHAGLLTVMRSFLKPCGLLLLTMGSTDWPGAVDHGFHGADMYWSHFDAPTNHRLVEEAGFKVELDTIDLSGGEHHQVLLAVAR